MARTCLVSQYEMSQSIKTSHILVTRFSAWHEISGREYTDHKVHDVRVSARAVAMVQCFRFVIDIHIHIVIVSARAVAMIQFFHFFIVIDYVT